MYTPVLIAATPLAGMPLVPLRCIAAITVLACPAWIFKSIVISGK